MRPDPVPTGTVVVTVVGLASVAHDRTRLLKIALLFARLGSKFVPLMFTVLPGIPIVGLKLVIVGASDAATVKADPLVAEPAGDTTAIGPVVAPGGTVATISVGVASATFAAAPLKETAFSLAIALNP